MLAALPKGEMQSYLDTVKLKAFTPTTRATPKSLLADLEQIRSSGFALDLEEGIEGIRCAAAVILDDYHYPVAAVTVIGPVFRMAASQLPTMGAACIRAAQHIRERLIK
ncbi:MAG: DNA-binding IclR family transcriptional regulator [Candidatus Omnitrophota bacterium]